MSIYIIIAIVLLLIIIICAYASASKSVREILSKSGANKAIYEKSIRNDKIIFLVNLVAVICIASVCVICVKSVNSVADTTSEYATEYTDGNDVFSDVEGTWAEEAVMYLADEGIVSGVGDNMFGAERNITRAEFVTMLMRMLENEMGVDVDISYEEGFSDVPAEKYYSSYLTKAKTLGIASGYDGNLFKPDNTISRQDMFVFTERALNMLGKIDDATEIDSTGLYDFYDDANLISPYAYQSISNLTEAGIISGSNNMIRPLDLARRNEAAQMLYGVISKTVDDE
jgi:endo-1,4-beta-xylanase